MSNLIFPVTPIIFTQHHDRPIHTENSVPIYSLEGFAEELSKIEAVPFAVDVFDEARSVVEGAKAISRPQKRVVDNPGKQTLAAALSKLEAEIANFDQNQRRAALVSIPGPQRIRGLAGSGKTVILAMKAAHLHLTNPTKKILFTFYTRSLRATIKNLVTRFYRHYKEEDPDWGRIHIRHGWGGASNAGCYADTCRDHGFRPLNLADAQANAKRGQEPFDFVCRELIEKVAILPKYDYVLIDEGQDFPSAFYELCFNLTKGSRDEKSIVWAYDELQNILNVTMRSPEKLFGTDVDGQPRISLDRTASRVPPGATNDTVLGKCYRNQREVLVTAHALGFGIYRNIVQMLEGREHWQDVGYEVLNGSDFHIGDEVRIRRPAENSPVSLDHNISGRIIDWYEAGDLDSEIVWVVSAIKGFIEGGLQAEDIIVIALDDRNARLYLKEISKMLATEKILSNNIIADPYSEPPFSMKSRVTLSTVYRAKGNEAAVVFAMGIDGVNAKTRSGRNKIFTALTRSKAWLRVSGISRSARLIGQEIDEALSRFPELDFVMPDLSQVNLIQRDLSQRQQKLKKLRDEYIGRMKKEGFSEDEIYEMLQAELKNG